MKSKVLFYGIIARIANFCIPVKEKHWVFGANFGKTYGEGPRNLMEFVLTHDSSIRCTYITQSKDVYSDLRRRGINCEMNCSFRGVWAVCKSDCVFVSHVGNDIFYAFRKKNRQFYYLMHGQSYKIVLGAVSLLYWRGLFPEQTFVKGLKTLIWKSFFDSGSFYDSHFVSACSDFISQYTRLEFPIQTQIKILGSPRNDILFNEKQMQNLFFDQLKGRFIIAYMPTHRLYGKGIPSPTLFINDLSVQQWLKENDVVILIKQHPNMALKVKDDNNNNVIIDITKMDLDPHLVIYHTDLLITDYSSVWIDYLLLRRPIIFFLYDNFRTEDAGYHYELSDDPAGEICTTQTELFNLIQRVKNNYRDMCPSDRIVSKYHKYIDGRSCERHYFEIIKRYERS